MNEATKPEQTAAQENPWYRLATLHGSETEHAARNRLTWNRWMARRLPEELKAALRKKGWSDQELTPFSEDEQRSIKAQVRSPLEADSIDFSNTKFDYFVAQGFVFPGVSFRGATFSHLAYFEGATFGDYANFEGTTFGGSSATFERATFCFSATFDRATFNDYTHFEKCDLQRQRLLHERNLQRHGKLQGRHLQRLLH